MKEDKLVFDVSVEDLTESESDDESVANNEGKQPSASWNFWKYFLILHIFVIFCCLFFSGK